LSPTKNPATLEAKGEQENDQHQHENIERHPEASEAIQKKKKAMYLVAQTDSEQKQAPVYG